MEKVSQILYEKLVRYGAQDAGTRNMAKAGRDSWNEEDWNVAANEYDRLLGITKGNQHG